MKPVRITTSQEIGIIMLHDGEYVQIMVDGGPIEVYKDGGQTRVTLPSGVIRHRWNSLGMSVPEESS